MKNLPCPIRAGSLEHPEAPAVVTGEERLSYGLLDSWIEAIVARLRERGFERGMRVGVLAAPGPQVVALFHAMQRAGLVFVPISPRIPAGQVERLLEHTQARGALSDARAPSLEAMALAEIVGPEAKPEAPVAGCTEASIAADQESTAIFTSGSSSEPKVALHRYGNHFHSAHGSNQNIALGVGDGWLLSLPLYHVAGIGILMRCAVAGAAVVVPEHRDLERSISGQAPSHLSLVATQLTRLLEGRGETHPMVSQLRRCKGILLGGSAIPDALLERSEALGLPIHVSYGSTEMASQITTTPPGSCRGFGAGKLLPHRQLRLDRDGEIQVRGETLFAGYLEAGELRPAVGPEGWFSTGDLGEWRGEYLHVLGRKDAMFISGGENIQPEEIERALERHRDVDWALVVDIPHAEFGARPCAFVKMRDQARLHSGALRDHLSAHIARFKIPDRFYHWPRDAAPSGIKWTRSGLRKIALRS